MEIGIGIGIAMDTRLAETIVEVQDVCNKHGLDLMDLPCGALWMELVGIALGKINAPAHPQFNIQGCQTSRFCGTGEPNISALTKER